MAYDLNAYLEGRLTAEETARLESELAQNPELQAELDRERELREHLAVIRVRMQVRDALSGSSPDPVMPAPVSRWRKWGLLAAVLGLGAFWFWYAQRAGDGKEPVSAPVPLEEPVPAGGEDAPAGQPQAGQRPDPSREKPTDRRTLASANPAYFRPNPVMESLIDGGVRSEAINLHVAAPGKGEIFSPDAKGRVTVRFSGTMEGLNEAASGSLMLSIFNNRDAATPAYSMPLPLKKEAAGKMVYDTRQRLEAPRGLYYFMIEANGEVLYMGKFFIGQIPGR